MHEGSEFPFKTNVVTVYTHALHVSHIVHMYMSEENSLAHCAKSAVWFSGPVADVHLLVHRRRRAAQAASRGDEASRPRFLREGVRGMAQGRPSAATGRDLRRLEGRVVDLHHSQGQSEEGVRKLKQPVKHSGIYLDEVASQGSSPAAGQRHAHNWKKQMNVKAKVDAQRTIDTLPCSFGLKRVSPCACHGPWARHWACAPPWMVTQRRKQRAEPRATPSGWRRRFQTHLMRKKMKRSHKRDSDDGTSGRKTKNRHWVW